MAELPEIVEGKRRLGMEEYEVAQYSIIPSLTLEAVHDYVDRGIEPGGFVGAVLSNDLFEAVARVDDRNLPVLGDICQLIYNYAPVVCHGSLDRYYAWIKRGGLAGRQIKLTNEQEEAEHGESR